MDYTAEGHGWKVVYLPDLERVRVYCHGLTEHWQDVMDVSPLSVLELHRMLEEVVARIRRDAHPLELHATETLMWRPPSGEEPHP